MTDRFDIEKRARELCDYGLLPAKDCAIQLARETVLAISDELYDLILAPDQSSYKGLLKAQSVVLRYASPEPGTREKRLERALLNIKEELQQIEFSPGGLIDRINKTLEWS